MARPEPDLTPDVPQGPLPGARSALALLLLINLFNYVDRQVLAAVVGPIKRTFFGEGGAATTGAVGAVLDWFQRVAGFKPEDALVGVLGTAFMVTYMLGAPVFGRLAERRSRWAIIGAGVIVWSLASGASGLAAGFVVLLLTRCFVGIGEAAYGPVAPTLISDFYPVRIRGQVLAWFYVAIPVGSALGYVLGGQVAGSEIGAWGARVLGTRPESWRWAFYLVVLPGIVLGAWSCFMRDPPRGQADLAHAGGLRVAGWRDYLILLKTPSYVLCSIGMAAMTFAMGGMGFWMPYYLEQRPGAPGYADAVFTFGAITAVAGLASTLLGGWVADALRKRIAGSYFLVSGIAMLVGFPVFLAVLHAGFPTMWGLLFLASFCLFFNTGPTNTVLANVTHPSMRATAFALNILFIHTFGDVASPVIIGLLTDYFDGDMSKSFLVVGFMFLVAGVTWLAGVGFLARDTRLAPHRLDGAR